MLWRKSQRHKEVYTLLLTIAGRFLRDIGKTSFFLPHRPPMYHTQRRLLKRIAARIT